MKNREEISQRIIAVFAFLGVIFLAAALQAQTLEEKIGKVDALFEKWDSTDSPGCSIAIIKEGKIIYSCGYGMANLDYEITNKPETVFRIGSTSKQFTAACIQALHEIGKLSLDDDIRKYVPEMPEYERAVTIRHLVHHTSGIRDYLTLQSLAGVDDEANYSPAEVVDLLSRQKELNFMPGDEYLYSNSGYLLLGVIVERVSGKSLSEFAKEYIFKPLGMINTHFHDDNTVIVKNRATGYAAGGGGFRVADTINECVGDGAVFTTVKDLFLWDRNFYDNRIISPDFTRNLQQTGVLNDGTEQAYAFGLRVDTYRGLKIVRHGGSFVGFRADMARFPNQRFTVICLANLAGFNPSGICDSIADIFLADDFTEEKAERQASRRQQDQPEYTFPELTNEQLGEFVGEYYSDELLVTYVFSIEDGKLAMRFKHKPGSRFLKALDPDLFSMGRIHIRFMKNKKDAVTGYEINAGRVRNIYFERVK